jgi:membrane protease YdiL (CAAX protease family)
MNARSSVHRLKPWLFFALTYGWSWLFLVPAALSGLTADAFPVPVLRALGGVGPTVSAILLVYLSLDEEGRRDYWRRLISPSRINPKWYAVVLITVPLLTGLSALVDLVLGGTGLRMEAAARFLDQPLAILPFILFILLFGPLPEEMGWRGYALDGLQARWSALASSVVLGVVWASWHLPLFFIEGTFQSGLGVATASFWIFMLGIIPQTIIMTWIYNNNRRSTLSAVLFHFMLNFTGELFELSQRAEIILFGMWIVLAVTTIAMWGPKRLSRE